MKASEARRRWFELLDDVISGEEVVIERKGHRVVIRADPAPIPSSDVPDYSDLLRSSCLDEADAWSWEWSDDGSMRLRDR